MGTKNKDSMWVKSLTVILSLSLGLNVILLMKRHDVFPAKKDLMTENKRLDKELHNYKLDFAMLKGITTEIDEVVKDAENRVTDPGMKNLFIVITDPLAQVVVDIEPGDKLPPRVDNIKFSEFSLFDMFDYNNKKVNFCTQIKPAEGLLPGLYVVELFTDKYKLGTTTFSLK